jgi:hypothetical protein
MVDVTEKERVNFFVLLRHAALLPTTKAGIETIGRPADLCLYQFLPPFLSLCIVFHPHLMPFPHFVYVYACVCVCVFPYKLSSVSGGR